MTDTPRLDGEEPDVVAAELALGLLEGEERAAALRRSLADPGFAREVERWRSHFGALFGEVRPAMPPVDHGERVIARLDQPARPTGRLWKPLAIGSSLVAASLLAIVVTRPAPRPPETRVVAAPAPMMVAAFMIEGQEAPRVATYDARAGRVSMPGPMPIPAGHSAQLWAIVGDAPPRPLGLFHIAGDRVEADARAMKDMAPGTTLAISLEPTGGSPTGAPTGPVVATGALVRA